MSTFFVSQEGPLNALALNRDNTQVAICGRNVLKVYQIEDDSFREICNLRGFKHLNLSFSCNDVAWSSTDDHYLATAATNGHVSVWNLTRTGKAMQEQDYQDHKRTVNRVNFHSSEPFRLISGSQDGTMRYFDIRLQSAVSVFHSNMESVRDVQFNPHNTYTFSAVSDNGSVQLWDIRKPEKCMQQFTAHSGPVFACDWHPELPWLATASRDKTVKVWDFTANKPTLEYTLNTIASAGYVKWRPQRKYHIASCSLVIDCSIYIWDLRRPYVPFMAFNEHKDIPSCVAFRGDPYLFLSSGRDWSLYQHSFHDGQRLTMKANPQAITFNKNSEVIYAKKTSVSPTSSSTNNNSSTNSLTKATVGLMRKISSTQTFDSFHQSLSGVYQFRHINQINSDQSTSDFVALAKNYILHGRSVSEMCEHNSIVSREHGKTQLAVIWNIVKAMYGEEFMQNSINANSNSNNNSSRDDGSVHNLSTVNNTVTTNNGMDSNLKFDQISKGEASAAQFSGGDDETENEDQIDHVVSAVNAGFPNFLNVRSGLPKGDFSFGENELDMELDIFGSEYHNGFRNFNHIPLETPDWTLPNEAFSIRHEILDRSPPPENFHNRHSPDIHEFSHTVPVEDHQQPGLLQVSKLPKMKCWDASPVIIEALRHHANLGDIQSSVTVLMVLGDSRKYLKDLNDEIQEHWLLEYIELLNRHKLWNISAQIIKLAWIPSIYQLSQQSTTINTNCGKCMKPLLRAGWQCDKCHSREHSLCSICHQVVRGLYVWCQGCSHGGHIGHMKQWFAKYKVCPTGCGHMCEYG